jgi:hypothetical protein
LERTGDADLEASEAEELGDGVGEAGAEGCLNGFLRPEAHVEVFQLSPGEALDRADPFQLANFHPAADVIERDGQDLGGSGTGASATSAMRARPSLFCCA